MIGYLFNFHPFGGDDLPLIVQGIVRDSPKFDSSFDRGRTLKAKYKRAQLSLGLEEALADMKPGGVKMVFLVPELSIACPKVRIPSPLFPPSLPRPHTVFVLGRIF